MGIPMIMLGVVVGAVTASAFYFMRRNQQHNYHTYKYDNNR